ncbi:minor tail protein [Arthrobacter phage Emotion]|uniref:Minor tail protein n=1 Tax=Arthrobacter phage Emotion TaxID=3038361 RepID=A0AA49ESF6_9CAUD|nr:minor tail protein [Arthrobacter phage Emotion]
MTDARTARKVARDLIRLDKRVSALSRTPQLASSSIEDGGAIESYDSDGTLAAVIGKQFDGGQGVVVTTGPTPPTPTAPAVVGGIESVTIRWDGLFGDVDGVADETIFAPTDFSRVEVHLSDDPDLTADTADTLVGTIESPRGGEVLVAPLALGTYYARLVARSVPGKAGAASAVGAGSPSATIDAAQIELKNASKAILESGQELGQKLQDADTALEAHDGRLEEAEGTLTNLKDVELPALEGKLDTLETVTLPALEGELTTLKDVTLPATQDDLKTLKDVTLPALDGKVNTLQTVDLPALSGRLDDAEDALAEVDTQAIADAKRAADMALLIAPISTSAPVLADGTVNGVPRPLDSIWTRIDANGNEIGYWRWTASGWVTMAMSTTVIPNLAASKITSGTIATARLNAQEIAAAVATVIELNADRITSGTVATGRLNAQEIAAAVATVIELNASRITAGTVNTARLNTSEIAAAVATVIQLNADRITSGTVNTDRLNASEIAAKVATIIELNASRITAGTVATARLNAQEIAAATASFQTVDIANLFTSAATIKEAVVEKFWAEVIRARKITADQLLVGSGENLVPDPNFTRTGNAGWSTPTGATFDATGGMDGGGSVLIAASATQDGTYLGMNDANMRARLTPGAYYKVGAWVRANVNIPIGGVGVYLRLYPETGTSGWGWGTPTNYNNKEVIPANTWREVSGIVFVPEGVNTRGVLGLFKQTSFTTSPVRWSVPFIKSATDSSVIVDGGILARHLNIVAGDPTGARMELKPDGLKLYGVDGSEAVNLSAVPPQYVGILDSEGNTLAALADDGTVSGSGLNVTSDPVVMGSPLLGSIADFQHPSETETVGILDFLPRGMVSRGFRAIGGMSVTGGEMELSEINFESTLGRAYRINVTPFGAYVDGGGAYGALVIRYTNDGTRPTLSSPILHRQSVRNQNSADMMLSFGGTFYYLGGSPGTIRLLATVSAVGGTVTVFSSGDGGDLRWWVEDMGLSVPDTGVDRTGKTGTTVAPPPEKKNYTKTYTASGYRSFYESNGGYYAYNTSKMYQGASPVAGGLQSIATFPSMTGDLSGATITSIKAYFYFEHWYYNSGGTAKIGVHGASSIPSTRPSITTVATSSSWPKPGGRWVSIPSSYWAGFKSGTYRGVALGDTSPSLTEYGYARGSSTKIEIKYTK